MAVKRRSLPLLGAVFRSALLLLALWAGSTAAAELTRVVAVVNNEPITSTELQQYMVRAKRQVAKQGVQIPEDELRQQVLEQMILEKLQLQVAKRMGITIDDTAIDRAIEDIARRFALDGFIAFAPDALFPRGGDPGDRDHRMSGRAPDEGLRIERRGVTVDRDEAQRLDPEPVLPRVSERRVCASGWPPSPRPSRWRRFTRSFRSATAVRPSR